MEGPAWCMHTHRWAATRGECRAIELESFDGKEVVIATTFHTHGVAAIPYKDSFILASGSALTLSHTSACLWTEAQAGTLVESIAAACAPNERPEVYSQNEGPAPNETRPFLRCYLASGAGLASSRSCSGTAPSARDSREMAER